MSYTNGLDDPTQFFNTILYTGNGASTPGGSGSTQTISSLNFAPDWVWIKDRSASHNNNLMNSIIGAPNILMPDSASASEVTDSTDGFTAFTSNGFTLGDNGEGTQSLELNKSGNNYVAWNWKAGGTAPAITYNVKVVSDSGNKYRFDDFGTSAVTLQLQEGGTYTFDQSDSSNSGHPLRFSTTSNGTHGGGSEYTTGVTTTGTPGSSGAKTVITVSASAPTLYYYCTQHSAMGGQANTNSTHGSSNFSGGIQSVVSASQESGISIVSYQGTGSASTVGHNLGTTPSMVWIFARAGGNAHIFHKALGSTQYLLHASSLAVQTYAPVGIGSLTSTTFSVGTVNGVNGSGNDYLAYVFADVKAYSKIGSYTGNGSSSGTYVHLGFKPAFVYYKKFSGSENHFLHDNKRQGYNPENELLFADLTNAEGTANRIDLLSNGFKATTSDGGINGSGATYIFMAFAESPFVNSNGIPTTAR